MVKLPEFSKILENGANLLYNSIVSDNDLVKEIVENDKDGKIDSFLSEWRYSDEAFEMLDRAADNAMKADSEKWSVFINYNNDTNLADLFYCGVDGLDIYNKFEEDIFDETKKLIIKNVDKIREKVN